MKLVQKLTLALILAISCVLAANSFLRARREVETMRADRIREHRRLGVALGAAFEAVWRTDGRAHALEMLAHADVSGDRHVMRWVPRALGQEGRLGEPSTVIERGPDGALTRRTTVPLIPTQAEPGVLEIAEPMADERLIVREIVLDRVRTTLVLVALMAVISGALGAWLVGRPLRSLAEKARRVGQGDFSGTLGFRQRDEVGDLGREMDAMCAQLIEAHARSDAETAARIAALSQLRRGERLMTVGTLASGVAHELGTPLNVISVRAGMIAEGEAAPKEIVDYARIIVRACEQMTQTIRQLLDFARPRPSERALGDLTALARRTAALLAPIAAKRRVEIELAEDAPEATAMFDPSQLEQVLANVIVNAIQASTGRGRIVVTVTPERAAPPEGGPQAETVCVRVRDDGPGIAPEHLPHVFEPFFTTKDVGHGTGLGLSVAYGIVQEHGGWMVVDSAPGRGSEFAIFVPKGARA